MEILCIIPARGGSKGIPHKNIVPLGGKPLLAYSIEAALEAPSVSRVVVSTDDEKIAGVANRYGAEVVWRPDEISGDEATSESALLHVLGFMWEREAYNPDLIAFLQATSPLRQPGDVQNAIDTLLLESADSLFSACKVEGFVWREEYDADIRRMDLSDPQARQRRQEISRPTLEENGSIYVFRQQVLPKYGARLGGKIAVYLMDRLDSFQVDEPRDLELMERLLALRKEPVLA